MPILEKEIPYIDIMTAIKLAALNKYYGWDVRIVNGSSEVARGILAHVSPDRVALTPVGHHHPVLFPINNTILIQVHIYINGNPWRWKTIWPLNSSGIGSKDDGYH